MKAFASTCKRVSLLLPVVVEFVVKFEPVFALALVRTYITAVQSVCGFLLECSSSYAPAQAFVKNTDPGTLYGDGMCASFAATCRLGVYANFDS